MSAVLDDMVMGRRPEVATASVPITALDALFLGQQLTVALARIPFRRPLQGHSSRISNLGQNVTREVIRSFMGYVTSLPVTDPGRGLRRAPDG